ncbi:hypothetical protein [Flavobacterium gilvum]|uniref:Uncharacterized protein n=1 Tax=Flavobacterium gilvum TaxID=1492737 RepID=A0AAC9N657_9FLAO|nr:hypothetical protein [Flavobacterium gilvum]AOW10032.1 hypothetical protein EM308_11210 [Flavobacterium gilvum]
MATQKQVDLYRELNDIKLKATITIVVLLCFVIGFLFVIYLICSKHPWQNTALVGTLDGLIAMSFPYILKHHFPNRTTS